jgi:Rad3-related DNA helicase
MTLAAGQGKTMVYLLTAMLLHRKYPQYYEKILVVTISNPLQKQLEEILMNHPIDVSIKATCQANIDEYKGFSLIIVDEADRYIR